MKPSLAQAPTKDAAALGARPVTKNARHGASRSPLAPAHAHARSASRDGPPRCRRTAPPRRRRSSRRRRGRRARRRATRGAERRGRGFASKPGRGEHGFAPTRSTSARIRRGAPSPKPASERKARARRDAASAISAGAQSPRARRRRRDKSRNDGPRVSRAASKRMSASTSATGRRPSASRAKLNFAGRGRSDRSSARRASSAAMCGREVESGVRDRCRSSGLARCCAGARPPGPRR